MKKSLAMVLVLVLLLSFAACGAKPAASSTPQAASAADDSQSGSPSAQSSGAASSSEPTSASTAMESLIDWMRLGTFSYDFTLTSEYAGQRTEATGSMAMDGGNMAMTMEQTVDGVAAKSRILFLDGEAYIIDDASKMIIKAGALGPEMTGGLPTDYANIAPVGSGEGEVNGKTLPYEEYTTEGVNVKYYMDGGMVYAIESTYEGYYSLMIVTNASSSVPAGAFELPEGYTEMEL